VEEREQEKEIREFAATTTTTIKPNIFESIQVSRVIRRDYIFNHIIIVLMKMKQRNYL
jgi:hypothetical protein